MKQYIVNVENCWQCPHSDHSGRFTDGGAIPLCRGIAGKGEQAGGGRNGHVWPDEYASVLPFEAVIERGRPVRRGTGVIPDWCPLPEPLPEEKL